MYTQSNLIVVVS